MHGSESSSLINIIYRKVTTLDKGGDVAVLENSRSRVLFSIYLLCVFFRDRPSRKLKKFAPLRKKTNRRQVYGKLTSYCTELSPKNCSFQRSTENFNSGKTNYYLERKQ